MKTSPTIEKIAPALVKAIGQITPVKKDGKNPFLKNKYATLDNIIEATKHVLTANGLCVFQPISDQGIETIILHTSGEWIASDTASIPAEISKGLSAAQSRGVAITYMKRYQLGAMLGISTDDDTDGQYGDNSEVKPAAKPPVPADKFEKLVKYCTEEPDKVKVADAVKKYVTAFTFTEEQLSKIKEAQ